MPTVKHDFHARSSQKEYMDRPGTADDDFSASLSFIEFVNRFGGGNRAVLQALRKIMDTLLLRGGITVADVGCGPASIVGPLRRLARHGPFPVTYEGSDISPAFLAVARRKYSGTDVRFYQSDVFTDESPADIVICSMLLHHFDAGDVERALRQLYKRARSAVIINDLYRSPLTYMLCFAATRFVPNRVCRHDALLSVRKGFRPDELQDLFDRLGLRGTVWRAFGGRVVAIIWKDKGGKS